MQSNYVKTYKGYAIESFQSSSHNSEMFMVVDSKENEVIHNYAPSVNECEQYIDDFCC